MRSPLGRSESARAALEVLARRRGALLLFAGCVLAGAVVATARTRPLFRAEATLAVEPPLRSAAGTDWFTAVAFDLPRYIGTQQERLRSPAVLRGVVEAHGKALRALPEYAGAVDDRALLEALADRIRVEGRPDTYLVDLAFPASDPEEAAAFVNDLAEAACLEGAARVTRREGEVARLVSDKIAELEARLKEAEGAVARFQRENDVEAFEEKMSLHAADLGRAVEARTAADLELARREPPFRAIESARDAEGRLLEDARVATVEEDPLVAALEKERTALELDLAAKRGVLGNRHPELVALVSRSETLGRQLGQARGAAAARIVAAFRQADEVRARIAALVDARESALATLGAKRRAYETLLAKAEEVRGLYREFYRRETGALDPGEPGTSPTFGMRVEVPAVVPRRPWRPNWLLNLGAAAAVALFGGLGLAFLLEALDEKVRDLSDLDAFVEVRSLGVLPWVRAAAGAAFARIADRDPQHAASEAFRGVRTALFGNGEGGPRCVLVTSAGASEGKTSTAVNLAITLAQGGHRTLLLDADLRRPRVHEVLGLPRSPGVSEAIASGDLSATRSTEVEFLSVLAAGSAVERPTEALGGEAFRRLLDAARRQYDRVVVDSPPAHLLADGRVLAARADATVVVARAGRTRRRALALVVEELRAQGTPVAGIVLNSVSFRGRGYGYGYGGGHGAGSRGRARRRTAGAPA